MTKELGDLTSLELTELIREGRKTVLDYFKGKSVDRAFVNEWLRITKIYTLLRGTESREAVTGIMVAKFIFLDEGKKEEFEDFVSKFVKGITPLKAISETISK